MYEYFCSGSGYRVYCTFFSSNSSSKILRINAISMIEAGFTQKDVARTLRRTIKTVNEISMAKVSMADPDPDLEGHLH